MWRRMVIVVASAACDPGNPCDEYVDYMCDCHPEVSCSDFELTYADPDPNVQDECAVLLDEQEEEDAANGDLCLGATDTGTSPVE